MSKQLQELKEKKGFAIIDEDDMILYSDFDMTEKEFRCWYRNQIEQGLRVVECTIKKIN